MTSGPKYRQLADELIGRMRSGLVKPGERLPSRNDLKAEGWGERTIHEALRVLSAEGWIRTEIGAGTFAADPLPGIQRTIEERLADVERRLSELEQKLQRPASD